jgi:hypothetical protein
MAYVNIAQISGASNYSPEKKFMFAACADEQVTKELAKKEFQEQQLAVELKKKDLYLAVAANCCLTSRRCCWRYTPFAQVHMLQQDGSSLYFFGVELVNSISYHSKHV